MRALHVEIVAAVVEVWNRGPQLQAITIRVPAGRNPIRGRRPLEITE